MIEIYETMYTLLQKGESFCLATILFKTGSAPRGEGAKMIIKKDFSIIGTIGGGFPEALTIKLCKNLFENKSSIIKHFNLSNKEASSLGLVCGGELKVLIEHIDPKDMQTSGLYIKGKKIKEKSEDFVLVTRIKEEEKEYYKHEKWICTETTFYGVENNEVQQIFRNIREEFKELERNIIITGKNKYLVEPVQNCETVYVFGAGHISQQLAQVTKMVEFKTVVLDDRNEFANRERFKMADDVIVVQSFNNVFEDININNQSYIVIVTRGHAYDSIVLAQALETQAKYIGMIGSKSKRQFVYNKLLSEGYTQKDLDRVHSPIGLEIHAETPEEIAISIAAELIKVRRIPKNGR